MLFWQAGNPFVRMLAVTILVQISTKYPGTGHNV